MFGEHGTSAGIILDIVSSDNNAAVVFLQLFCLL